TFRDPSGDIFSVEVRSTGGDDFRDKMLLTLANDWKQIGVDGQPVIIPRQRADDREYRVTRPAFELVSQPTDLRGFMRFHSSRMPTPQNDFRGDNRLRYANPDLDAHLDRMIVTIPADERSQILGQLVHL